jgi:heptosyltransferase-2
MATVSSGKVGGIFEGFLEVPMPVETRCEWLEPLAVHCRLKLDPHLGFDLIQGHRRGIRPWSRLAHPFQRNGFFGRLKLTHSLSLKPKLLIVELWGLGDLVIATPFLRAAAEKFEVTLLAKPYAKDLQTRFWPEMQVVPFNAPWTAFKHKYRLWAWPWREIYSLRKLLRGQFDVALSARWDPRDHFLLALTRARRRLGFARMGSRMFLTHALVRPAPTSHRYEYWRTLGRELGMELPAQAAALPGRAAANPQVLIHSGAGQPIRVWPLARYLALATRLREKRFAVQIACDVDQQEWWIKAGEKNVSTPHNVTELIDLIDRSGAFIGNDSGPGHLAALAGIPTFTFFGPQLPEWFGPMHPASISIEGKPCPYKPCSDYCRFPAPLCLHGVTEDEIAAQALAFAAKHLGENEKSAASSR